MADTAQAEGEEEEEGWVLADVEAFHGAAAEAVGAAAMETTASAGTRYPHQVGYQKLLASAAVDISSCRDPQMSTSIVIVVLSKA